MVLGDGGGIEGQEQVDIGRQTQYRLLGDAHAVKVVPAPHPRHIVGQAKDVQPATGQRLGKPGPARLDSLAGLPSDAEGQLVRRHVVTSLAC